MHRDFVREAEIQDEFDQSWRGRLAEMACCVADPDEAGDEEGELETDEELPDTLREPETQPSPSQLMRERWEEQL
jgi:hypothetical protein